MKKKCPYCGKYIELENVISDSVWCPNCSEWPKVVCDSHGRISLRKEEEDEIYPDEDNMWNILVDKIVKGDVIPVIGEDIVQDSTYTIREMLIGTICKEDNIKSEKSITSFSQLIYNKSYNKDKEHIYGRVCQVISKRRGSFKPSNLLRRILSIKQFPFIITTSFDSVIEDTMREIWSQRKRDVKTLIFNNNPKNNGSIIGHGDLSKESDIENPTVYYMFGKAPVDIDMASPHSYVLTDEDMLTFCRSWMSEDYRPKTFSSVIGRKYLLFLGCNYPDWLVRFVWYSMRSSLEKSGMFVGKIEKSLEEFMGRVHVQTQINPEYVVGQIEKRLIKKKELLDMTKFDNPPERIDIFISYSRKDEMYAKKLYDKLISIGLNVWYDRKNLAAGDRWLERIKKAIENSKFCLILLSDSMIDQVSESHVYRREWNMAIDCSKGMAPNRGFIIPVSLNNLDINREKLDLPSEIPSHNALFISAEEDYDKVANAVIKKINDLTR